MDEGTPAGFALGSMATAKRYCSRRLGCTEFQVAEFAGAGLSQAGVQGVQHAGQFQGAQAVVHGGVDDGHRVSVVW